jgi:hypothetical protein
MTQLAPSKRAAGGAKQHRRRTGRADAHRIDQTHRHAAGTVVAKSHAAARGRADVRIAERERGDRIPSCRSNESNALAAPSPAARAEVVERRGGACRDGFAASPTLDRPGPPSAQRTATLHDAAGASVAQPASSVSV